jgi:hypothetical protein
MCCPGRAPATRPVPKCGYPRGLVQLVCDQIVCASTEWPHQQLMVAPGPALWLPPSVKGCFQVHGARNVHQSLR